MKKIMIGTLLFMVSLTLVACASSNEVNEESPIELMAGENYTLDVVSDEPITFTSSDETIAIVHEEGTVEALSGGTVDITIEFSNGDTETVEVIVEASPTLSVDETLIQLHIDDTAQIQYDANSNVKIEAQENASVSVSEDGTLSPYAVGHERFRVYLEDDESVEVFVDVYVYETLSRFTLEGNTQMNIHERQTLNVNTEPEFGYPVMNYTSSDPSVIEIDGQELVAVGKGEAVITASQSQGEETLVQEITIEVDDVFVVSDEPVNSYLDLTINDQTYFSDLNSAMSEATSTTRIYVVNQTIEDAITIDQDVHLLGDGASFNEEVLIDTSRVKIEGFTFGANAFIHNTEPIDEVTLMNNIFNDFDQAIRLEQVSTLVQIDFNVFNQGNLALSITESASADVKARFNQFTNIENYAIKADEDLTPDFTLNYFDELKVDGVSNDALLGRYETASDVLQYGDYDYTLPAMIVINNPIHEMMIDDHHQLTYTVLPYDLQTDRIRFITSNPDVLTINQDGTLAPKRSGEATVTVRAAQDSSINTTLTLDITTYPGVELVPDQIMNGIITGDTFTLDATPFPVSYEDENIVFSSSDEAIATIDQSGNVVTHQAGVVTLTGAFESDDEIFQTYTFEVFDDLDDQNLLDILTQQQVMFSTPHTWMTKGITFNYEDTKYESVSRYYFEDALTINTDKMVPVSDGIRPGEPMDEHPEGVEAYNEDNVYWVVVHETANTAPGANALSHANYLYDHAVAGNVLYTSWHYTIDDTNLYQHLPENERGYHAGDGSSRPTTSSEYLGGGNRNGIGIEMSINEDGDLMRTWQRTAKHAADIAYRYNLPTENVRYHKDFSGKICPRTLIEAELVDTFEDFVAIEYLIRSDYQDASITMESHNPEYLDDYGRVIKHPDQAQTVSYTVTITQNNETESRTFYTYLPGTMH